MSDTGSPNREEDHLDEAEVTEGNWNTPQVEVKAVEVVTGEEDEEAFWVHRAKLFRWSTDLKEWKERGLGDAKLLKHKTTGKIRFLLRQDKTLKIVANHYVLRVDDYCKLAANCGSEKIWVWTVKDYAEDEFKREQFGLKFRQVEQANIFKEKFEEAAEINARLFALPKPNTEESTPKENTEKEDEEKKEPKQAEDPAKENKE